MGTTSPRAASISGKLSWYYRAIIERGVIAEQIRLTELQIAEAEKLITGNGLIPSQGVARYEPGVPAAGTVSDPTPRIAARHLAYCRNYRRELSKFRARLASYAIDLYEIDCQLAPMDTALARLTTDQANLIECYYRDGRTMSAIAEDECCDQSTISRRMQAAMESLSESLCDRCTPIVLKR